MHHLLALMVYQSVHGHVEQATALRHRLPMRVGDERPCKSNKKAKITYHNKSVVFVLRLLYCSIARKTRQYRNYYIICIITL